MRESPRYADPRRPCDGCGHSAAGAPFPGYPSGERPCCFCVRNPSPPRPNPVADEKGNGVWYDGKTPAVKTPMDCYIATERSQQERVFDALRRIREGKEVVEARGDGYAMMARWGMSAEEIADGRRTGRAQPCCSGEPSSPETNGHAVTCICVIGVAFG